MHFGLTEIFDQDYSIMGWTSGNGMATPRDTAKFFYDLLGPEKKVVSQESYDEMIQFERL